MAKKIIGITGPFGSGKSTAAEFFTSKGYKKIYLSSYLENEALKRKLPVTRKILQDIGNELRGKYGNGILVKKALKDLKNEAKIVIDGVRNIGEIEEIRKHKNSVILAIIADRKIRFERLRKLKRREKLTVKLFDKLDSRDLGIGETTSGQQVAFCVALADVFIDSNESMKEFQNKLSNFLEKHERN